jgi:hypothetical protein
MSIFDSRKPRETLEQFFLRVNQYFSEKVIKTPSVPAAIKPGPTDANGTPVEETPETETRSGALHPPYKTGI